MRCKSSPTSNVIFLVSRKPLLQGFPNYPCDGSFVPLTVFHQRIVLFTVEADGNLHGMGFFRGFSTGHGITPIQLFDVEMIPKGFGGSKTQEKGREPEKQGKSRLTGDFDQKF